MNETKWDDVVHAARAALSKAYEMGADDVKGSTVEEQRALIVRCQRFLERLAPLDKLSDDIRAERRALLAEIEAGR